jgi:hypothetical protein
MAADCTFASVASGSVASVPAAGLVITIMLVTLSPESGSGSGLVAEVTTPRPTALCWEALGEADLILGGATDTLASAGVAAGGVPTVSGAAANVFG